MLYSDMFMSRYESLLRAAEPIPLYALKLLVSMTEHNTQICRYWTHNQPHNQSHKKKQQNTVDALLNQRVALLASITKII